MIHANQTHSGKLMHNSLIHLGDGLQDLLITGNQSSFPLVMLLLDSFSTFGLLGSGLQMSLASTSRAEPYIIG
ncbi:hypothetical protein PanWU01x14_227330 [Parasponia andersonii]|uniref:Uncharacterized protein n=1 Tax=Parasponia andersonii TaxID=3476 RepID=A0A2P5BM48_PARAD|nr:hypothetical protein PanWU01x14_227330 [Parasponia andersonii]